MYTVVQDMHESSKRCAVGVTDEFNVVVALHQRSALSPLLSGDGQADIRQEHSLLCLKMT